MKPNIEIKCDSSCHIEMTKLWLISLTGHQDKTLAAVLAMKNINFNLVSLLLTEDQSISVLTVARVACGA